jgi:HAD superfamily hydrolase (TIGR01509 family)
VKAAIFDLDGTLLDSLPLTFTAFREALRPWVGRDLTDQEIYARFGPADHEIVASWAGPEHAAEAVNRLMDAYARSVEQVAPYDGVLAMLEVLKGRGLRLALCTGRGRPSTELLIQHLGLGTWFDVVVTGEEVPCPKPEPDGILRTAELLEIPPGQVLYTGDSVKDVDAGVRAGAFTVAALWAGTEPFSPGLARAHALAHHPREIVELLKTIGTEGYGEFGPA